MQAGYFKPSEILIRRPFSKCPFPNVHGVNIVFLAFGQPVFVITTGAQAKDQGSYTPLDEASACLQRKGAAVFVLGIGKDVDNSELSQIASSPDNVFTVDSFEELEERSNSLKRGICQLGKWRYLFFFFSVLFFFTPVNDVSSL